jgi:hypothetical protein
VEESEAIKMAQLKSYIRGLFWSTKDNIYTANLNNVDDTVMVHDTNDGLALQRLIKQDSKGFKDGQSLRDLYHDFYEINFKYNNIINDFVDDSENNTYGYGLDRLLNIYTVETTQTITEPSEDETLATVTIEPTESMVIVVDFYDNTTDYDINVTITDINDEEETFTVKADKDNAFKYYVDSTKISKVDITWVYDDTHNNTVTTLTAN